MAKPTASFNGSDLATYVPGLIVVGHDPYRFPTRNLNIQKLAGADKSANSGAEYQDKKVNVLVEIGRDTRELLDASIDSLNAILQEPEAALITNYGSGYRQWTATLNNIGYSDVKGGHASLDIEFTAADPLGRATASTTLFSNNLTGASNTASFIIAGSHLWQQPIITITISALTGGTNKDVTIANATTSQSITITRTWTAGDVIVIDCSTGKVTVNGSPVAFSGAVPKWKPGAGSMSYNDTLTTRTRQTTAIVYPRYV